MSLAGTDPSKHPPRNHLYLAALVLSGSLLPTPIVAIIFTAAIFIAQPPALFIPYLSTSLSPSWLAILAGFVITLIFWLVLALFFRHFTSIESANPVSANHLNSHVLALRAGFEVLKKPEDIGSAFPKEYLDCYSIAYAQVQSYIEEISYIIIRKDSRWVTATGYIQTWLLVHRAEEAMIMLVPRQEVIREALYDELAITGSSISALPSVRHKLEIAVSIISATATQYLDITGSQDTPADLSRQEHLANAGLGNKSILSKNQLSIATAEISKSTDEKDTPVRETSIEATQTPGAVIVTATSQTTNEQSGDTNVILSTLASSPSDISTTTEGLATVFLSEMEARSALRDVRRTICEYRDHLWEGLVTGRNLLLGTALITGLITYVLLCFAIVAQISIPSITAAIAYYLVAAVVGLFGRLYDESKTENVSNDYGMTLARIIVTPVLSGIAGVVGVLLTALVSLTLFKSALPQTSSTQIVPQIGLVDSFDIQRNTLGLLIAAAFALTPNLLINTLKKKANDFAKQLQSSGASGQSTSNEQSNSGSR